MDTSSFYNELIMEHSMNSPYKRKMDNSTFCSLGHNPSCGDKIEIQVLLEHGIIKDIAFVGSGCAISQSSTSIMIQTLLGKTIKEAQSIINIFLNMIKREKISQKDKKSLKNAIAFENVSSMPTRAKCATLSWHTLLDVLDKAEK